MKKTLLSIFLFSLFSITAQEVTHIDFDNNNPDIIFNSWNNSSTFTKVANPNPDDTNNQFKLIKNSV